MSYEAAVLWSIVRSLLTGAACLWLARGLVAWRASGEPRGEGLGPRASDSTSGHSPSTIHHPPLNPQLLLLVPFFMPGLVVGYAYRNSSLSLVQMPWLNELLYLTIVIAQLTPVAVLALEWLPAAAMSGTGAFLLSQVRSQTWRQRVRAALAGEFPREVTAFVIAALLCFQEVEVATLMQARGWAEWIFTKQAGGVELSEVWRFLVLPVGYGVGLVLPVLWYWVKRFEVRGARFEKLTGGDSFPQRSTLSAQRSYLVLSWLLVVVWPISSLAIGAFRGRETIHLRTPIWREIGDALIQAGTVTGLLWGLFRLMEFVRPSFSNLPLGEGGAGRMRKSWLRGLLVVLILPGMLGSLALGLAVFEICQRIGLQPSYSPVPLVAAMVLFLLPRALAMRTMLQRSEGQSNLFLARQMAGEGREMRDERLEPDGGGFGRYQPVAATTLTPNPSLGGREEPETAFGHPPSAICPLPLPNDQGPRTKNSSSPQPSTLNSQRSGRSIVWHLHGAGRFWTLTLLFWWSYLELTLPSILRPAGMAPAPMRLYNFLHYGHIPGLAAMLVVVLGVPFVVGGLWLMVYRKILRA